MTRLKRVLIEKKMSQTRLANLTDIGGDKISLLCSGKVTNTTLQTMLKICTALDKTLDECFGDVLLEK